MSFLIRCDIKYNDPPQKPEMELKTTRTNPFNNIYSGNTENYISQREDNEFAHKAEQFELNGEGVRRCVKEGERTHTLGIEDPEKYIVCCLAFLIF